MKRVILLLVLILLVSSGYSFADVPCKINYQGRLIKDNVPVHNPTGVPMIFKVNGQEVYNSKDDGDVPVYNGLFRVVLNLESIKWTAGETLYLEVIIDGEQLTPREPIYAYPYAINSHLLEGKTTDYFLNASVETQTKDGGLNIMGNVGIGTTSPGAKLEVAGDIKITGGSPGNGKVLASNSAGLATWRDMTPRWSVKVNSENNSTLPSQFTSPIATFSLPSFGSIFVEHNNGDRWGYNNSVLFEMTANSNGSQTKTLKLFAVDNYVYVYLRGTRIYSYTGAATFDDAPISVTFNLTNGDNLVQVVFADQGGYWYLSLVGDLIDNSNVFYVTP